VAGFSVCEASSGGLSLKETGPLGTGRLRASGEEVLL
jgi:hypothetical protein